MCYSNRCSIRRPQGLLLPLLSALTLVSAVMALPAPAAKSKAQPPNDPLSTLLPGGSTGTLTAPPAAVPAGPLEPTGAPSMPTYQTKESFDFAVMGNSSPPAPGLTFPTSLYDIFNDLELLHPDLLIHTGNFIWAKPSDQAGTLAQMTTFREAANHLSKIPMYIAAGSKDVPDEEADVAFRKLVSGGPPWRSFNYGNSHFIILDTEVPDDPGKISGSELNWLKSDLEGRGQQKHTFVFLNRTPYPTSDDTPAEAIFSSPADRDAFTSLMSKYHVSTVFSGGQAVYSASTHDDVNYVNTGGGGSPTKSSPMDGGFLHYVNVSVNGNNISVVPVQPGRIDFRPSLIDPGTVVVYNTTSTPLVLNRVTVLVPWQWRTRHVGLLGPAKLSIYQVSATATGPDAGNADAAPVDLQEAKSKNPSEPDFLFVRVAVPADSAVTVKVQPTS